MEEFIVFSLAERKGQVKGFGRPENRVSGSSCRRGDRKLELLGYHVQKKVTLRSGSFQMSIRTNPLVLNEYRARFGKNIIFTDHVDWGTEEIVRSYRDRYKIETAFRWTKDPALIRWQPMYHWTDSKIRVHGLTCVIALLYLSLLHRKLKNAGLAISLDRAMEALRAIRPALCRYPKSPQTVRKVCRLSSTEQELLTALNLQIEAVR
jgi:hypothetical protein